MFLHWTIFDRSWCRLHIAVFQMLVRNSLRSFLSSFEDKMFSCCLIYPTHQQVPWWRDNQCYSLAYKHTCRYRVLPVCFYAFCPSFCHCCVCEVTPASFFCAMTKKKETAANPRSPALTSKRWWLNLSSEFQQVCLRITSPTVADVFI